MCVAIPAQLTQITPGVMPMARARQGDRVVDCCLAYLPQACVGDYVLLQHGFAMELLDDEAARESLEAFASLGVDVGPLSVA
jgi:hydrogenase expression/formation protein HypC